MNKILSKVTFVIIILFAFILKINAYYEAPIDITKMDVYELQDAVDKGYLSYELIARLYLDRIDKYDSNHKAVITINKNIVEEAKEKDKEYKEKGRSNILFGLPVLVKDNIDVKGLPTTNGTKSLSDSYPYVDSDIIKNLKDKGMLIIAKTNMSEFAFSASSSISSYGITRNAYNRNYSSYGSSGGTAVGIALQYAPFGIGTDTNSSLRAPAAANNIIGYRPTLNKLSSTGIIPYDTTRDTPGPMTKSVIENALLLEALEGKEEGTYSKDLDKTSLEGVKIGVLDQFLYGDSSVGVYGTGSTYSKLKTLMDERLKQFEEQGATIIHLKNFYSTKWYNVDSNTLGGWTMCYGFNNYIKGTNSKIKTFYQLNNSSGHISSIAGYTSDCTRNISSVNNMPTKKQGYKDHVNNTFSTNNIDVLVYPTTKNILSKVGGTGNFESPAFSIAPSLGLPAVSIPLGLIDELPYGMDLVSLQNTEAKTYEIIYNLEKIINSYELPKSAPNIYEIPESVTNLIEFYETSQKDKVSYIFKTKKITNYLKELHNVEDFLFNYNDYEDKDTKAQELYKNYEKAYNKVSNFDTKIIIAIGIFIVAFIFIIFLIKKILKKKNLRFKKRKKLKKRK